MLLIRLVFFVKLHILFDHNGFDWRDLGFVSEIDARIMWIWQSTLLMLGETMTVVEF